MVDAALGVDLFKLDGRVFIVTGASSGIGLEIARGLAAAGAIVGLNSRNRERLEARCQEIPGSFPLPFDVADLTAGASAIASVVDEHGKLDGIVCNAASRDRRPLQDVEPEDFRALLETNLVSPFELARVAARHMVPRGTGRIIFLTSLAGDFALPGDAIYPGTKAGLSGIVRSMAVNLGQHGINVNGIAPGPVASEMNQSLTTDPEWAAIIDRNVPLGRWAEPSELAGTAIFLASDASSYVNGHIITVDGGTSVRLFP